MKKILSYVILTAVIVTLSSPGTFEVSYVSAASDSPASGPETVEPTEESVKDVPAVPEEPAVPAKVDLEKEVVETPVDVEVDLTPAPNIDVAPTPIDAIDIGDDVVATPDVFADEPTVPNNDSADAGNNVDSDLSKSCAVPDSLNDETPEVIMNSPYSTEPTLQSVLDDVGFSFNVVNDQKNYQTWTTGNQGVMTVRAELITKITSLDHIFGYYINGDLGTFKPLFKTGEISDFDDVPLFEDGQSVTFKVPASKNISFAINLVEQTSNAPYRAMATRNAQSVGGGDQVLVYGATNTGDFIIAFEDSPVPSDNDYQDVVIKINFTDCGKANPPVVNTPPILTLLGNNPTIVFVDETFTDMGATAIDRQDGNLTSSIVATGTVNTSVIGSYTVTYTVTDSGRLTATTTRIVNVIPADDIGGGGNTGKSCAVPDSLGDTGLETIIGTSYISENTLQTVLTNAGFSFNAVNDQKNYQTWTTGNRGTTTVTVRAELIAKITSLNHVFGYYINGELGTFTPLFKTGARAGYNDVPLFVAGQSITFKLPPSQNISFGINLADQTSNVAFRGMSTRNAQSTGGGDQAIVYGPTKGGDFVIAFEDSPVVSDNDYQDVVIKINFLDCGKANPGEVNTPPVLTLVGGNPMNVFVDETFTDPGATATDRQDGNLTPSIVATGTVDTTVIGSYTRSYSVTDSGRLTATTTRTVNVIPADDIGGGGGGGGGGNNNNNNNNNGGGSSGGRSSRNNNSGRVLGASTGPDDGTCTYLESFLHRSWNNSPTEVLKLQYFLQTQQNFPNLKMTGSFDNDTFDAVSQFQSRYFGDILNPWGHTDSTGFVYILTKKKVNELFCDIEFPLTSSEAQEIAEYRASTAWAK